MIPPAPAGIKLAIPINGTVKRASFHGSTLNQPKRPVAPLERPYLSNVANKENAVINDGIITINVKITWKNFQAGSIPGSVNWWWKPTGMEKRSNKIND